MEQDQKEALRRIVRAIEAQKVELDLVILKEPTGPNRDIMTDAQIHLSVAVEYLHDPEA
jgi:hypothetical protein